MRLSTYPNGEGHVVEVEGELTSREPLQALPRTVGQLIQQESPPIVKVNVKAVDMVDLEGIAALLAARKLVLRTGAAFQLVDAQPRVRQRLKTTGVLRLLEEGEL
jgi:anti-anti-sigma factor